MNQKKVGITVYLTPEEKNKFKQVCRDNDSDMAKTLAAYAKKRIKECK